MKPAPHPADEPARQAAVDSLSLHEGQSEPRFDAITQSAAEQLKAPICTISIIDHDREWYKSHVGISASEGARETSFCGHTIVSGKMFIVEDTQKHPDFKDNPQVTQPPHIRFYAGITLHDARTHQPIGAFCIKDTQPRSLSMVELNTLLEHAERAEREVNNYPNQTSPDERPAAGAANNWQIHGFLLSPVVPRLL